MTFKFDLTQRRIWRSLKSRKFIWVFSLIFSICSLMFILTALFICLLKLDGTMNVVKKDSQIYTYKYTQFNTLKNTATLGIARITTSLDDEEYQFLSYDEMNEEGGKALISKFGTGEYLCTGVCSCEDHRRVTSINVLNTKYLIAAASISFAQKVAKSVFNEECYAAFSDSTDSGYCPKVSIKTEIDTCDSIDEDELDDGRIGSGDRIFSEEKENIYLCIGNCMTNIKDSEHYTSKCRDLELDVQLNFVEDVDPEIEFQNNHLHNFCMKNSMEEREDDESGVKEVHVCEGSSVKNSMGKTNPTISCRMLWHY